MKGSGLSELQVGPLLVREVLERLGLCGKTLLLFLAAELRVDVELVLAERLLLQPAMEEVDELHGGLLLECEDAAPGEVEGDFLEEGGDEGVEVEDVVLGGGGLVAFEHFEVEGQHQAHQHLHSAAATQPPPHDF